MNRPLPRIPRGRVVSSSSPNVELARSLANGLPEIHGESRAEVLESGGRVDKGVTSEARSLGRDRRQWTQNAHHARSTPETDSGGLKLSVGMPPISDAVAIRPQFPSQGKMTYASKKE